MNELQIFSKEEFGSVRAIEKDGEPWFVGKDVSDILGYQNGSRDVNAHVDEEDRLKYQISTAGQMREQTIINESGLYSLVLSSKLPTAKQFKRWITAEVIPSIRKNGGYIAGQQEMTGEELMAKALLMADKMLKEKEAKVTALTAENESLKPKALFADAVSASKTSVLIGDLAKVLKQNGIEIGQNRLFQWLRLNGFLMRHGNGDNVPTQKAMEMKLFELSTTLITTSEGEQRARYTVKVTGKGQQYFINKFLGGKNMEVQ